MAPHTGSATPEQIDALLNFLDEQRDLARGRLRSVEGKVQAKRLWENLCNCLNSMGGCTKTIQQWQKVWFDRKYLAKKAAADARKSASGTGGGSSTAPQLSQRELKVLSIMGDGFGGRQTSASVPAFHEINEPSPYNEIPSTSQPPSLDFPELVENAEPSQEAQPSNLAEPASERLLQEPSISRTHSRRRRSAASRDVKSRFFQLEEGKGQEPRTRRLKTRTVRHKGCSTRVL